MEITEVPVDDPMKLDLEEAMQRIRRFCELRPSYPDYAMIAHSDYSDAIRMGHLRALCVPPEALRREPDPLTLELADELFGCFLSRAASDADHSWQCAVCDEPVPMPDWITSKHAEGCAVAKARDYLAQHAPHRTPGFVVSPLARRPEEKT